jgi:hypothetical protein
MQEFSPGEGVARGIELIEAADSEKLRKAAERLHAVVTARAGVLSDDEPRESVRKPPGDRAASRDSRVTSTGLEHANSFLAPRSFRGVSALTTPKLHAFF